MYLVVSSRIIEVIGCFIATKANAIPPAKTENVWNGLGDRTIVHRDADVPSEYSESTSEAYVSLRG